MSNRLPFLLNALIIFLESIMTAYLANFFFQRTTTRYIYIATVALLGALSCIAISIFEAIPPIRIFVCTIIPTIWIVLVFRAKIAKALFFSVFLMSYWTIVDSVFLMIATIITPNAKELIYSSPYAYYLISFGAKGFELLGIAIICSFSKGKIRNNPLSWTDWVRTLFFPVTTLIVSFLLLRIFYLAPETALELSVCACILLTTDAMSIHLLDYLETQQIAQRDNAILRQNLKTGHESIEAWVSAYKDERKRTHDF